MAKRRLKKVPKAADLTHAAERLRKALVKRTKDELVDVLVELAREDHKLLRRLDARFELEAPPKELVAATRQAIADATDFDEREINYNFDYDYEAYSEVKRNLGRLIDQGHLRQAMELSLELMKEGSYQVEMSDEGLMTSDIEECFSVVVKALKKCDLPPGEVIPWCEAMAKSDRVGFIYERELSGAAKSLRGVAVVGSPSAGPLSCGAPGSLAQAACSGITRRQRRKRQRSARRQAAPPSLHQPSPSPRRSSPPSLLACGQMQRSHGYATMDGTVYSLPISGGTLTTLFSFGGGTGGINPRGGLTLSGSNLYGMTSMAVPMATAQYSVFR